MYIYIHVYHLMLYKCFSWVQVCQGGSVGGRLCETILRGQGFFPFGAYIIFDLFYF